MKTPILSLFLCLLLQAPAGSQSEKPYLAVFCNDDPGFAREWQHIKPDLLMRSSNWEDFKLFVSEVKRLSGDDIVWLDVDCHGQECSHLYLDGPNGGAEASFGYILNQVDKLPEGKVELLMTEACYAGCSYHNTMYGQEPREKNGTVIEDYKGELPLYPVYGVSNVPNYGNSVYVQMISHENVEIYDLRKFDGHDPGPPTRNKAREQALLYFYRSYILSQFLQQLLDK